MNLCRLQMDIRQENRLNTLTISEGQEIYLKFLIVIYLTSSRVNWAFFDMSWPD
jgi:thiaminase